MAANDSTVAKFIPANGPLVFNDFSELAIALEGIAALAAEQVQRTSGAENLRAYSIQKLAEMAAIDAERLAANVEGDER